MWPFLTHMWPILAHMRHVQTNIWHFKTSMWTFRTRVLPFLTRILSFLTSMQPPLSCLHSPLSNMHSLSSSELPACLLTCPCAALPAAGHIACKPRTDVLPGVFEVAGSLRLPLAPRPEVTICILPAAGGARLLGGLRVGGSHQGVVAEVGSVVLFAVAGGGRAKVAGGADSGGPCTGTCMWGCSR